MRATDPLGQRLPNQLPAHLRCGSYRRRNLESVTMNLKDAERWKKLERRARERGWTITGEQREWLLNILPALETNVSQVGNLSAMLSFFARECSTGSEEETILWAVSDHLGLLKAELNLNVSRCYSFVWGESVVQTRQRYDADEKRVAAEKGGAS